MDFLERCEPWEGVPEVRESTGKGVSIQLENKFDLKFGDLSVGLTFGGDVV